MSIDITDSLTLAKVKQHLQVDMDDDSQDELIQSYIDNSLSYVTNYTSKTFEIYNNSESFLFWENDIIILEWLTEVRIAVIEYTDTLGVIKTINTQVYANNVIREPVPEDYNGGNITVEYIPYIDNAQIPISHQARLLIVGDWFISRENTIMGTQIAELNNTGINNLLNSIKLGFI